MAQNKKKKKKADGTEEVEPVVGFYDPNQVEATSGLYDPSNTYGRTPTNPNIGTFDEWLANQGLVKNKLKPNQKQRLKDEWTTASGPQGEFATTPEGEQTSNEDPDRYWNYLMGEAGALSSGMQGSQFGQYLESEYKGDVMRGYDAAKLASGNNLNYADYMSSIGWAPGQQTNTMMGAPPRDTGNPYTSTSMPQAGGLLPKNSSATTPTSPFGNVQDFASQQGLDWKKLNDGRQDRLQQNMNAYDAASQSILANAAPAPTLPNIPGTGGSDGLADARLRFLSKTPQQRGINSGTSFRPGRWAVYG